MLKIFISLLCILFFAGCNSNKLDPKHLTNVTVIRDTEGQKKNVTPTKPEENTREKSSQEDRYRPSVRKFPYYIIVASYPLSDRSKAEKLTKGLKDQGYPAQILEAKGRLRVSIENLSTEEEARAQRDKYREITDRQDIWILKTED